MVFDFTLVEDRVTRAGCCPRRSLIGVDAPAQVSLEGVGETEVRDVTAACSQASVKRTGRQSGLLASRQRL